MTKFTTNKKNKLKKKKKTRASHKSLHIGHSTSYDLVNSQYRKKQQKVSKEVTDSPRLDGEGEERVQLVMRHWFCKCNCSKLSKY